MAKKEQCVYQFKITLQGTKPPIWRRIQILDCCSLWDLHVAIQDAMGWGSYHLHTFESTHPEYGERGFVGNPTLGWDEEKIPISSYFSHEKQALYVYDFEDNWRHKINLEKILPLKFGITYPQCLDGKRACPPEDCGGVKKYKELLKIIKNPKHIDCEEHMEWVGDDDFDPEYFNPDYVDFSDPKEQLGDET